MVVLTEKFPFIREDVFLCPFVDTKTGKQWIKIQKVNLETSEIEFEDSIDCIHTAITDISVEEYDEYIDDDYFQEDLIKKTLEIRSSEDLEEINLNPEEKFFALKSWAAGIAEAGYESFKFQMEIDTALDLAYPMTNLLLRFMIRVDLEFLEVFLSKIDRECRYNGERHNPSYIANLLYIFRIMEENDDFYDFYDEYTGKEHDLFAFLMEFDAFKGNFVRFEGEIIIIKREKITNKYLNDIFDNASLWKNKKLKTLDLSNRKNSDPNKVLDMDEIDLSKRVISDINEIEGLQYATDLERLIIGRNYIKEIKNLENLRNLQELYLNNNQISEIKGLNNLTNLTLLHLNSNRIKEIKNLENLRNLQELYLNDNQISKIKGLTNLTNLKLLHLNSNNIEEIKNINNLTNLQFLSLNNNKITKIEKTFNLTKLRILDLGKNNIEEIIEIENLTSLTKLNLAKNNITEIENLNNLANIKSLNLSYNKIKKIEGIQNLKNLENLDLSNNMIKKIQNMENLVNLTTLVLSNNQIEKFENLNNQKNLKLLDISDNIINEGIEIGSFLKLQEISVKNNYGISPLPTPHPSSDNPNMTRSILRIKGLEKLKDLRTLRMTGGIFSGKFRNKEEKDIQISNEKL